MNGLSRTSAVLLAIIGLPCFAMAESADLKVTRVALFSSGVGYFECAGTVTDSATAELKFRTEQINDILKSLVVQDFDGGSISTVSYASQDPTDRALRSFAVDLSEQPSLAELLDQLRGEQIEIGEPRATKGTIIGVEKQKMVADKTEITVEFLNIFTDSGLLRLRLTDIRSIKLTNEKINAEFQKALATLAASHDADKKSVIIRFDGKGQRRVRASFLLESPIWKTSYRLVLAPDKKPFLQGWATVDNATEEDWKDIKLSLIAGHPISFKMDLYTPLYVPRHQEQFERYASLRPQEYEGGMIGMGGGVAEEKQAGATITRKRAGQPTIPAAPPPPPPPAPAEALMFEYGWQARGVKSIADAKEVGELFEYAIDTPVSVARQRSAMLPIVNKEIAGEKVSIFNTSVHPKYPLNGLEMENTTGLQLTQGPVTLFDGNTYAGDAKLPDIKPGEKRLVSYALDLGMEVLLRTEPHPQKLVSVKIIKGTLHHARKWVDERVYTIKSKDKKDRTLIIEQPYTDEWKLIEPKKEYERTQNLLRFKLPVPSGKTVNQTIRLEKLDEQMVALTEAKFDMIQMFIKSKAIPPAVMKALEKVISERTVLDQISRDRAAREKEVTEAVEEQARIRENIKTLQPNSDLYQRQLKKFDGVETQIEKLRGQVAELRTREESKRAALESYLVSLNVE